jgi:hypothetical protein
MTTKNDFFTQIRSDGEGLHLFVGQGGKKDDGVRFTVLKERVFSRGSRFDLVRVRIKPEGLVRCQTFGLAASAFKVWIGS